MKRFTDIFTWIKGRGMGAPAAGALSLVVIFGAVVVAVNVLDSRLPFGAQVAGVGAAFSAPSSAHGPPEVDNDAIASVDLDHFDANMVIANVDEDAESYFVTYKYDTFSVDGSVWKKAQKNGELVITKSALLGDDVEKYAIEQLRQVVESDLAYLKRVQTVEVASNQSKSRKQASRIKLKGLAIKMKDDTVAAQVPAPDQSAVLEPSLETSSVISTIETVVTDIASTTVSGIAGLVETVTEFFASATTTESTVTTTESVATTTASESTTTTTVADSATATTTVPTTTEPDAVGRRNNPPARGPRN